MRNKHTCGVHDHDCGCTVTGHEHNCSCGAVDDAQHLSITDADPNHFATVPPDDTLTTCSGGSTESDAVEASLELHAPNDVWARLMKSRERINSEWDAIEAAVSLQVNPHTASNSRISAEEYQKLRDISLKSQSLPAGKTDDSSETSDDSSEITKLVREFIAILDIVEESDSGNEFRPNQISSCRALDGVRMTEILGRLKEITK